MLGAGARQRLLDLLARRRLTVGLAEDLRDDQREDVGRAPVAVDAGRVDREVERAPPATRAGAPPRSCRGRRSTSCSGSSSTSRRRPNAAAASSPAELERELGDVERGEDVGRSGARDLFRRLEGVGRPADAPVRGHEPLQRASVLGIALEGAREVRDRAVAVAGREGGVPEADERGRVLRPQPHRAMERLTGLRRAPVVSERVAQLPPAVGVVRIERDGALEELDRRVEPELHRRPAGEPEERRIERIARQGLLDGVPGTAVLTRRIVGPRLVGQVVARSFCHRLEPSCGDASIGRFPPQFQQVWQALAPGRSLAQTMRSGTNRRASEETQR